MVLYSFTLKRYKHAFLVKGDTKPVKDFLKKDLKGKWKPKLGPGGWMFGMKRKEKVTGALRNKFRCNIIDETDVQPEDQNEDEMPLSALFGKPFRCNIIDKTDVQPEDEDEDEMPLSALFGKPVPKRGHEDEGDKPMSAAPVKKRPARPPGVVDQLHKTFKEAGDDLQAMRTVLSEAIKFLSAPRVKRGGGGGKMSERARQELLRADQVRLRDMTKKCLLRLWKNWQSQKPDVGASMAQKSLDADAGMLRECVDYVLMLIQQYETTGKSVEHALAGVAWAELRDVAKKIANGLMRKEASKESVTHEGKGTPALVQLALEELHGQGTAAEVRDWIEKNKTPGLLKKYNVVLNENATVATDRPEGTKVWHLTVSGCLSRNNDKKFQMTDERKEGAPVWRLVTDVSAPSSGGNECKRRRLS